MDKAAIYLYLPIIAAVFWGATYVVTEKVFQFVSVPTWLALAGISCIIVALLMPVAGFPAIDFTPVLSEQVLGWVIFGLILARLADVSILSAIKHVNATYAAVGEISYVFFVPVFSFLIFGYRTFNFTTLIGGLVIFAGVVIVIRGQYLAQN